MDETDRLLDDALDSLPLAAPPADISRRVMAEIWRPYVTFRLDFLDLALPGFFALCAALLFAAGLAALASLNPLVVMQWKLQSAALAQQIGFTLSRSPLFLLAVLAPCAGGVALLGAVLLLREPLSIRR